MEKGFRDFFLSWWRQPFDFDWTARHFRARGVLRVHQIFFGVTSVVYGLIALLTVIWAELDGGAVTGRLFVLAIAASSVVLGVLWMGAPWPTERQSAAFAIYADLAVLAVIACYQDAFTAMPGLALLAANGIYIVMIHGPRAVLLHLVFTAAVCAWSYGSALADGSVSLALLSVRLLVLMPTVIGIPVMVQSYLLALRLGAVDALHDPLTRLLNRRGLDIQIGELVPRDGARIGVLAVDIDKFKAINDGHGHDAGDRVLVSVANAARDAVSGHWFRSVIARTGGEEFVVVIEGGPSVLGPVAERLHEAVAHCDASVVPTVSIGMATARIEDGDVRGALRELIERADAAMYRAKNAGGDQTVTADDSVGADE